MSINKFSRFSFIQLNLSRIAFDNQKLQQTMKRFWDIFAWDLVDIKTHLKNIQCRLTNFRDFLLFSWTYRELHRQSKTTTTIWKDFEIFFCMGFYLSSKTHLKNIKYRLTNFRDFLLCSELIANCIRQSKNYNNYWKEFWIILHWI